MYRILALQLGALFLFMDQNRPLQFGSGSAQLGGDAGVAALNEAIARRQTGQTAPTQAVSPSSASFDAGIVPPQLPSGGAPAPVAPSPTPAQTAGANLGMNQLNTAVENDLLIKALSAKLKANSNIEKFQSGAK